MQMIKISSGDLLQMMENTVQIWTITLNPSVFENMFQINFKDLIEDYILSNLENIFNQLPSHHSSKKIFLNDNQLIL